MKYRRMRVSIVSVKIEALVKDGKISEAISEMSRVELVLRSKERRIVMKTFVDSMMEYNKEVEWNDTCHS